MWLLEQDWTLFTVAESYATTMPGFNFFLSVRCFKVPGCLHCCHQPLISSSIPRSVMGCACLSRLWYFFLRHVVF
jgi:hypothetical protein